MRYFPLFVDLAGKRVVVVGGGEEALRKVRLIAKTEAHIEVIAPELHPELMANPRVRWIADAFLADMLDGAAVVFSADDALNAIVSTEAQKRNIPVNVVDEAEASTFIVPSIVDRDPVVVAIGTEGAAPVLAQGLRAKIDALLPSNLGSVTRKAKGLREVVAQRLNAGNPRRTFWNDYFFGSVAEAEKNNDKVAYELALGDSLFNHAHQLPRRVSTLNVPVELDLLTLREHRALMEADYIVAPNATPAALLEMARRDAVRLLPHQIDSLDHATGNILHILLTQPEQVPFPVREDLQEAILRAAP